MNLAVLGEMFEGYSAETCTGKFPMGGRAEGPACADTGARTPIGASGNLFALFLLLMNGFNMNFELSLEII